MSDAFDKKDSLHERFQFDLVTLSCAMHLFFRTLEELNFAVAVYSRTGTDGMGITWITSGELKKGKNALYIEKLK